LILEANKETVNRVSDLSKVLEASKETNNVLLLVRNRHAARYVGPTEYQLNHCK